MGKTWEVASPKVRTAMTRITIEYLRTAAAMGVVDWECEVDDEWGNTWDVHVNKRGAVDDE